MRDRPMPFHNQQSSRIGGKSVYGLVELDGFIFGS